MYPPGLRLRRLRERFGLTYRDVERASFQIVLNRGRPDFILHISRLADMENNNVVPSLYKLYSLAAIYHLDPLELCAWYEAPFQQALHDGASFPPPRTHLAESLLTNRAASHALSLRARGLANSRRSGAGWPGRRRFYFLQRFGDLFCRSSHRALILEQKSSLR